MDMNQDIKSLTFGLRFKHSFSILDSWGKIVDDMLYNSKYFSPELFPNISTAYTTERHLSHPDKENSFILSSDNLVFTQSIDGDFDSEYKKFKDRVTKYIIPSIIVKYTLISKRLGLVYICNLTDDEVSKFASKYFNPDVNNITDFRFSRKESTKKGSIWKETEDFRNKIFTVGNLNGKTGISYDYQLHFVPARSDIRDAIEDFLSSGQKDFENDVVNSVGEKNVK